MGKVLTCTTPMISSRVVVAIICRNSQKIIFSLDIEMKSLLKCVNDTMPVMASTRMVVIDASAPA